MRVGVIGTGYVGLVTGTCFAEMGNDVVCVDNNPEKVKQMQSGIIPIYEPGLEDIFKRNIKEGRLTFTENIDEVLGSAAIFLALPTPSGEDGSADLSYILGVAEELGKKITDYTVIVDKSTVPIGTSDKVFEKISKNTKAEFDVVSNPEFLREGQAVEDFMQPERVVIGAKSERAFKVMKDLYGPFLRRNPEKLILTDTKSAEMIKYAANAFLANKISFMNQIAGLCELVDADVDMVRKGIGSDSRIGAQFLYAGPGYGGSCFPKDVKALDKISKENNYEFDILSAVMIANEKQKLVVPNKVVEYYEGNVEGKTFALWGLAFKDNTDDIRESPALVIIENLTKRGAHIVAFDPQATKNVKNLYGYNSSITYSDDEYEALDNADALIIATNWREFSSPDFNRIKELLKAPVIFDGRNLYEVEDMESAGIYYESIGRRVANPYE